MFVNFCDVFCANLTVPAILQATDFYWSLLQCRLRVFQDVFGILCDDRGQTKVGRVKRTRDRHTNLLGASPKIVFTCFHKTQVAKNVTQGFKHALPIPRAWPFGSLRSQSVTSPLFLDGHTICTCTCVWRLLLGCHT